MSPTRIIQPGMSSVLYIGRRKRRGRTKWGRRIGGTGGRGAPVDQRKSPLLEVSDAAVDEFGGAAGGALAPIILLEKGNGRSLRAARKDRAAPLIRRR
jgi:hypothetical protein